MDWIQNNWYTVLGSLAGIVGLGWLPFTRVLLLKGIKVLMSETFLKAMFFDLAEKYVKSTDTSLDDKFLNQLKNSFE